MPSLLHEALVELFRQQPSLAVRLAQDLLNLDVPAYDRAEERSVDVTQALPAEVRVDHVQVLYRGDTSVLAVITEVQLAVAPAKRFTWPLYLAAIRARFHCPVVVLAICTSESVARWASSPIPLGPASEVRILALGPSAVPVVADEEAIQAHPGLAVLSAHSHRHSTDHAVAIALAAQRATRDWDHLTRTLYLDLLAVTFTPATREKLDMQSTDYQWKSEWAQDIALKTKVTSVLAVLDARSMPLTDAQRQSIETCTDVATLNRWLRQAATAETVDEALS